VGICFAIAQSRPPTVRVGMVIGIKPDKISAYKTLHAASNPGVRDLLGKYRMKNFSINLCQLDDRRYYLFGYYEYGGRDYKGDMAKLAVEKRNIDWLSVTDPMQIPLRGQKAWARM
jgi:L-rhamnose mutarotase